MFDAFLKIDGIEGKSTDAAHQGWIEIKSCDNRITQKVSSTASSSGGASAERATFQDFRLTKELDKASPKLALACADGTHIDTVTIEFCRAGTDKIKFMGYKLTNCIISDYHMIADGRGVPIEGLSINFGKIEWVYTQQIGRRIVRVAFFKDKITNGKLFRVTGLKPDLYTSDVPGSFKEVVESNGLTGFEFDEY